MGGRWVDMGGRWVDGFVGGRDWRCPMDDSCVRRMCTNCY